MFLLIPTTHNPPQPATRNTHTMIDMALVSGNEDIVMIIQPYCEDCAKRKLSILKIYQNITHEEQHELKNAKIRLCKIKCDCQRSSEGFK